MDRGRLNVQVLLWFVLKCIEKKEGTFCEVIGIRAFIKKYIECSVRIDSE